MCWNDAKRLFVLTMFAWAGHHLGILFFMDDGLMPIEEILMFSPLFTCLGVGAGLKVLGLVDWK